MQVNLLQASPLSIVISAIRKCYESERRSDSTSKFGYFILGPKDEELLRRVVSSGHHSTIEHCNFTFDIDGISRGCLQELVRHRIASYSVKSTRYTLGRIKDSTNLHNREESGKYLVWSQNEDVNQAAISALVNVQKLARQNIPNDQLKYCLPEPLKTSLIWTINARSLRNFFDLRFDKRAHWEIRQLAKTIFNLIPVQHRILFEDLNVNYN